MEFTSAQAEVIRRDLGCLAYERSAAKQAFHSRNQDAYDGVSQKTVMNPVPGKPEHQEKVAWIQNVAQDTQYSLRSAGGTNSS